MDSLQTTSEADTVAPPPAPNAGVPHLDADDIALVIGWHLQGKTQEWIASKLNPPRSQSTISTCISKYGLDTTAAAKLIFRAQAAPAAVKILKDGKPRDLIAVQKGIGVLTDDIAQGITVIIGGIKESDIAPLACSTTLVSMDMHTLTGDLGSDNGAYVVTKDAVEKA